MHLMTDVKGVQPHAPNGEELVPGNAGLADEIQADAEPRITGMSPAQWKGNQ